MKKTLIALSAALVSLSAVAGGNVENGAALAKKYNCASCHGDKFTNPIDPSYPKLAGQHQDYLEHALTAYRRGGDAANGRANAIMGAQAKPLTTQEIKDLAAYLHSLPGEMTAHR
ncbi:cytochrome c [Massilia sp. TS11]|uniref:c-type cytochrome n=1 Tax=Massilia sp. TS11 TaxID=2908003 RepID=UPI001EDB732B|nr:cytochrome c [Massilia sp. TS11]MCG2586209.1 cytochrome c [Massilia sp. TS11]